VCIWLFLQKAAQLVVCVYARNLLAMDMCGLESDTARRLAGDKVSFCIALFSFLSSLVSK